MAMVSLGLAGWRIRLDMELPSLAREAMTRYAAFMAPPALPAIFTAHVEVDRRGADLQATPGAEVALRKATDAGGQYLVDAPGFRGRIDLAQGLGELTLVSAVPLGDLEHFLRIALALIAFREGGLLVHAAGLAAEGKVHLFIGQSGSGKSTAVTLSPGAVALNDDLIILRPCAEVWTAYGTPFWNMEAGHREGQTASGPLLGIYKLVQDTKVYLELMSIASATAELLANCPVINASPSHLPALLPRCRQLAGAVPVQRLHFRKDGSFWQLLEHRSQA
jgi:hypothetical protein